MREIYTVVVADDEAELLDAVCELIPWTELGFELVGRAGNGLDALQLVEKLQPDLLISDIRMPYISGIELAQQVRQLRPLTHIAFLSGYDAFEYAQKAIQLNVIRYLLKPISTEELTQALREMRSHIEKHYRSYIAPGVQGEDNSFAVTLLLDSSLAEQNVSEQALAASAQKAGLTDGSRSGDNLFVVAIEEEKGGEPCSLQDVAHSVDLILKRHCLSRSFASGLRIYTLLSFAGAAADLPNILDELQQTLSRIWGFRCRLGLSRCVDRWSDCHLACEDAVEALRMVGAETGVADFYQTTPQPLEQDMALAQLAEQLEGLIRIGKREELEKFLAENLTAQSGEIPILQTLSATLRVLYSSVPMEQIMQIRRKCRLPDELLNTTSLNDLRKRTESLCIASWELLSKQRKDGVRLLCERALEEINKNYADELLSLATVAEKLHVSSNYLSANMKKYVGDTFINLLIRRRMEAAGELIRHTNMKIAEIARRCGYSDQHYFSFCFKKYYGISPLQRRRQEERQANT